MMAERGLTLAHTTIMRRVQGFAPEFERRWNRLPANQAIPGASMRPISRSAASGRNFTSSRPDGQDRRLQTEPRRDVTAAKLFFRKALRTQGRPPRAITLDGYAASHRAVRELPEEKELWNDTKL